MRQFTYPAPHQAPQPPHATTKPAKKKSAGSTLNPKAKPFVFNAKAKPFRPAFTTSSAPQTQSQTSFTPAPNVVKQQAGPKVADTQKPKIPADQNADAKFNTKVVAPKAEKVKALKNGKDAGFEIPRVQSTPLPESSPLTSKSVLTKKKAVMESAPPPKTKDTQKEAEEPKEGKMNGEQPASKATEEKKSSVDSSIAKKPEVADIASKKEEVVKSEGPAGGKSSGGQPPEPTQTKEEKVTEDQSIKTEAPENKEEEKPQPKPQPRSSAPDMPQPKPQPIKREENKKEGDSIVPSAAPKREDRALYKVKRTATPSVETASKPEESQTPKQSPEVPDKNREPIVYARRLFAAFRTTNIDAPDDLPSIEDIIKKLNANLPKQRNSVRGGSRGGSGGLRAKQRGSRDDRRQGGRRNKKGQERQPKFLAPVKPLVKSENAYEIRKDKDEDEKIEAAFRRVLNKICPDNFDSLVQKVVKGKEEDLKIDTKDRVDMTANLFFEKAIAEEVFLSTYAQFCVALSKDLPKFQIAEGKVHDFRRVILTKCQGEFQSFTRSESREAVEGESEEEKKKRLDEEAKSKKRILGTIRLIGELYVRGMIGIRIISYCTELLSRNTKKHPVRPEFIEALCKLLETIGKNIENENEKYVNTLFEKLKKLSDMDDVLDFRHRFMIKDTIDLRDNYWEPRIKKTKAMTKDEFRKQMEKEEREAAMRSLSGRRRTTTYSYSQGTTMKKKSNKPADEWMSQSSRRGGKGAQDVRQSEKGGRKMQRKVMNTGRPKVEVTRSNAFGGLAMGPSSPPKESAPNSSASKVPAKSSEPKKEKLTAEQAEKKIKALLGEYLDARDFQEVISCIEELGSEEHYGKIVSTAIMLSVEKKGGEKPMGDVLVKLVNSDKVNIKKPAVESGYLKILKDVEDLALDYPRILQTMGTTYGRLLDGGSIDLSLLDNPVFEPLKQYGDAAKFVIGMLQAIKASKGDSGLVSWYKDSKFDLKKFMRPRNNSREGTIEFIKDRHKDLIALESVIE